MGFYKNDATAANNTSVNGIAVEGTSSPANIDNALRELAAQGKQFALDIAGANTVGGTADAITITANDSVADAYFDGMIIGFVAGSDNATTSPTANVNAIGAKTIKKALGSDGAELAVAAGDIQSGGLYLLRYRSAWASAAGAWQLIDLQHPAIDDPDNPAPNVIINGNFDVWQRATSQTSTGYGSADRWFCGHLGTTKTASQQAFTLGQTDVLGNPIYYIRHVVSSSAGAGNYCILNQYIEGVETLSGKQATLTFWAKADASKNIAIELVQSFGTGGSPSALVSGIESQLVALTTSWQRFDILVDIPSISGKTLGTNGDDWVSPYFWFDAGSDWNARTASLGQQSGTFDIARVSLREGDWTDVSDPHGRDFIGDVLEKCYRYYQTGASHLDSYSTTSNVISVQATLKCEMRDTPAITNGFTYSLNTSSGVSDKVTKREFRNYAIVTSTGAAAFVNNWSANAEL